MKKVLFNCLVVFLLVSSSYAQPIEWTAADGNDWHNPNNWDPPKVPDGSNDVNFGIPSPCYIKYAAAEANSVTIRGGLAGATTLNVYYSSSLDTNSIVVDGVVGGNGNITVFSYAEVNTVDINVVRSGYSLDVSSGLFRATGRFDLGGTLSVDRGIVIHSPDGIRTHGSAYIECKNGIITGEYLEGDLNRDKKVDFFDFALFAENWLAGV